MPEKVAEFQSRTARRRPEPEPIDLDVLYEDDALIVLNKAAGMVIHPTYKNWSGTVLNGLLWRIRQRPAGPEGPALHPSIVTRLDKETSGLVIAALRPEIHARIQKDSAADRVTKEYLAIVRGVPVPPRASIALPLARDLDDRRRVVVTASGQACETKYEVMDRPAGWPPHKDFSLVRCELVTGRTHQIRVHLAARGWPVVGDRVYGEPHGSIGRQALHAWRVALPHPVTRELAEFEAPVPADFEALWLSSLP
jgi:23S rRNA pseudouridine1911/1915/1917 synthase